VFDQQQRLLRAVLDSPDDDVPRLVYADWLREGGQTERADLITLQCAGREPETARRLLAQHHAAWTAELGPDLESVQFARGFPVSGSLRLGGPDPLAVMDKAPLRSLELVQPEEDHDLVELVEAIVEDPRLNTVQELILQGTWGPTLRVLLTRPRWRELRQLCVDDGDCSPELVRALDVPGIGLERLEGLDLCGDYQGDLGPGGLAALVGAPVLARLRTLRLLNLSLDPGDARALAASGLTRLQRLDLGWGSYNPNRVGPEGAAAIASSLSLSGLTQLVLDFNHVGDEGLAALARSSTLQQLVQLSLKGNELGDAGLRALAEGEGLPALIHLELTWNRAITAEGFAALVRSPRLAQLETLWIRQCPQIGAAGAEALASSPHAVGLRDLNLLECGLGPEGARALARSPYLDGLQKLQVSGNRLDEASRQRLVERFGERVEVAR
jgi:uncharacterized protein (TIGR02996 family)